MDANETEAKLQTILLVVEAVAYLALTVWCVNRSRDGSWALLGAVGSALVGIVLGISAAAFFEAQFLNSTHILQKVFFHEHISTVFTVGRVAGVLLLAAGFVRSRRTPPAPTASIYGS